MVERRVEMDNGLLFICFQAIAGRLKRLPITNKHSTATGKCH